MTEPFRDRRRAFREQEIVRTAAEVVAQEGCRAFTMNKVAARLGVSKATLYQHFESRDDLIRRTVGGACRVVLDEARRRAGESPPDERLTKAARYLVGRCLGVTEGEDDPVPCCLMEIECPFVDWDEMERLFRRLAPGRRASGQPGLAQALRALSASVLQQRKAAGRKPTPSDVEPIVRFLFPNG